MLHSRLAIIDRQDRANQPMRRGDSVFALNGQLFNYRELRNSLMEKGGKFATEGDTEVFLEQLKRHGLDGLDACEGMWAFALYEKSGDLVLCRDRFGEKPLYVHQTPRGIYWGSEIKFIRALAGDSIQPDIEHVRRYLGDGYKAACGRSRTFWKGIRELSAGTALVIRDAVEPVTIRYWQPQFEPNEALSLEAAIQGVRQRLSQSMQFRMRADVPIAFCMSSGVDSNALIAMAQANKETQLHGFTIASSDIRYEEATMARQCAERMSIKHSTVSCESSGFLDGMAILARQHDAPVLTISYYLHWLIMRAMAAQGYRVSISGTGADELLTGYYEHHNLWLAETAAAPDQQQQMNAWTAHIRPLIRNNALISPGSYPHHVGSPSALASRNLSNSYLIDPLTDFAIEGNYTTSPLRNRMLNELFHQVVPAILHEDDLNAMYYSIENRSPFLDRGLAEFCFQIPSRHLIRDAFTKYPLRAAMSGLIPDVVIWNRRKIGFNGSIREFINPASSAVISTILDSSAIFDIVKRDRVERLLMQDEHSDDENKLLFSIISAQSFLTAAHQN